MDRRASVRRPILLHAHLTTSGAKKWPCVVADFCAEGVYIKYSTVVSHLIEQAIRVSPDLAVSISFVDDETGIEHSLKVHPVRVVEGAMGCRFIDPNVTAISSMLRMCSGDVDEGSVRNPPEKARFILRQCSKAIIQAVEPLLGQFFDHADEALIEAASHATSDQVSTELMNAAGLLRDHQKRISNHLLQGLSQPLSVTAGSVPDKPAQGLSLVEKNEFEDWLMFKVMVTKAETLYRGALLQLKMRFDHLGVVSDKGYPNPLGPPLLVYAFRDSITLIDFPHCAYRTIFRSFEHTVMRQLEDLYKELNDILIRQNVLPDLDLSKYVSDHKVLEQENSKKDQEDKKNKPVTETPGEKMGDTPVATKKSVAGSSRAYPPASDVARHNETAGMPAQSNTSGETNVQKASFTAADHNVQHLAPPFSTPPVYSSREAFVEHQKAAQNAYDNIKHLFSSLAERRGAPPAADSRPSLSNEELHEGLHPIQQAAIQDNEDVLEPLLDRARQHLASSNETKRLSDEQEDTFDVVDRFFLSLKSSQKLTDTTKRQLKRLEVPLFKVLLKNKAFFEDVDSPVRSVINRVAQLGIKGGRPNPNVERKIEQVIGRINTQFDNNPAVFEDVLHELDDLIDRQNLLYRKNVERVTAAAEGEQKVEAAKLKVAKEIEKRIGGRKVPKAIVTMINGGWQDLLSLTHIRQGPTSQTWQDYLGVLDSLLAFAEDPTLELNLKELLQIIQEGLASISSNQVPSAHVRDELKRFIVGAKSKQIELIEMPAQSVEKDAEAQQKGLQKWLQRAQKMVPGEWLRYQKTGQALQFMRLVWIGAGYSRFVFVNHQGMKVIELDLIKLAQYLSKGLVAIEKEYETPIVDSSLDFMVKKVYDQLSFVATHDDLTGCVNRKEYDRQVSSALAQDVEESHFSVLHLDVSGVRAINEAAGYEAGDAALKEFAEHLKHIVPEHSRCARLTGNEFGVFLRDGDAEGVADHLLHYIQDHQFSWKEKSYTLGLNVGIAKASSVLSNGDKLLAAAEEACKNAKEQSAYHAEVHRIDHAHQLSQARITAKVAGMDDLSEERILLRCQKIIPLQSQTRLNTQYEILLSIYDDKGHLIPVNEFVRTAERYNRMQAVDRWVVGHMLDWMAQNQAKVASMGGVVINLSGHSLNDESLTEFIYDRLSQRDAPIEKLWFELTEASAISNIYDVADFMTELKDIGCRFCLGNFGAGMSSYHFLKELPVDMIKIDGTFIKNLTSDDADRAMIRSMTEMVHFMGKELIASQVEDKQCLEMLTEMGVDYAQGFAIEKPKLINSV